MSRFWPSLILLAVATAARAEPLTGLPPLPWPVPPEKYRPTPNVPAPPMVPLQPKAGPGAPLTPSPLLYVRLVGPAGSKVTVYRGQPAGEVVDLPAVVGFRPGYQYRLALSNIPGRPGVVSYPTFEVRGCLAFNHKMRAIEHPAIVPLKLEDLDKASTGTLITKMVVVERPESALPYQSSKDSPLEVQVPNTRDARNEANERGMTLALVYFGPRTFEPREMIAPLGTIYLTSDKTLPPPDLPANIPWTCYPLVDPILGPVHPSEFVSVYDGGDSNLPAGFNGRGKLVGVDPSDTVAEYVTPRGVKKLAISNRVALCIPRYILIRTELTPMVRETIATPDIALQLKQPGTIENHYELIQRVQRWQAEVARTVARPNSVETPYGVVAVANVKSTRVRVCIQTPETLNGACLPGRDEKEGLLICKWPDRAGANIGDLVMFSLKYTNTGTVPLSNVVVVDNLTPRFEYVPGSAKTDRNGTFTFQPNDAGSQLLRWEFAGELPPGESGLITFQVRVR